MQRRTGQSTSTLLAAAAIAAMFAASACDDSAPVASTSATPATTPTVATASATPQPSGSSAGSSTPAPPAAPPVVVSEALLPPLPPLGPIMAPADNVPTAEKIALGKVLFFDKRLGKDGKFACESCHFVDQGWADGKALSEKGDGKMNTRHTPSMFNIGYQAAWYWDGRATTLEGQVLAAWKGQLGVGDTLPERVKELARVEGYKPLFKAAFGDEQITAELSAKALACFLRSLRSGGAPFDQYEAGDKKAISESAARGWEIFRNKAACASCHAPPLFTDLGYHNIGVGSDKAEPDKGRGAITKDAKDDGKFKTPSLRSVTTHAPYFHDGSKQTIEEAVDFMLGGGQPNAKLDSGLKKVALTKPEREDLLAFIKALEAAPQKFDRPKVP
ncbi:MAG: cytochrome-c peroxidase [Myxococcales bacterium]|nr:cytochrome-c peroxidase [Myxococcales bacterium]